MNDKLKSTFLGYTKKPLEFTSSENSIAIGYEPKKITNCVFIGENAGVDIDEGDRITIIGDNIRSLDKSQSDVLFIGDKIAIGKTLKGKEINLQEIIKEYLNDSIT